MVMIPMRLVPEEQQIVAINSKAGGKGLETARDKVGPIVLAPFQHASRIVQVFWALAEVYASSLPATPKLRGYGLLGGGPSTDLLIHFRVKTEQSTPASSRPAQSRCQCRGGGIAAGRGLRPAAILCCPAQRM